MQVIHEHCCGLDVHKKTVVACAVTPDGPRRAKVAIGNGAWSPFGR